MSREVIAEEQRKIREGTHGETTVNIPASFGHIARLKSLMDWKNKMLDVSLVSEQGRLYIMIDLATPVEEKTVERP